MIVREVFDNGLCLLTESMPEVRSVSLGAWLTRGSRHEGSDHEGIAHLTEHMLFKGTTSRTAQVIAQDVDSIGGQLDAFTAKECAGYYIKVLDDHLPRAVEVLSDLLLNPVFPDDELEKEKRVILEEIKMVEDVPDDLVHEIFTASFWPSHPLGRSILGTPESVSAVSRDVLSNYFERAYVGGHLVVAVAGHCEHEQARDLIHTAFAEIRATPEPLESFPPIPRASMVAREKDLEQCHLCVGTPGYAQDHDDRYASYVLNTVLGSSMSSRLFQNVREKRGLAYAVNSSLVSYRDSGMLTVYAGCETARVPEVIDLVMAELRTLRREPIPGDELQRAKDHLKGNLVLSLESTTSRMSQLARSELCFGRQIGLSEHLDAIDAVGAEDVERVATGFFVDGSVAATVLGPLNGTSLTNAQLAI